MNRKTPPHAPPPSCSPGNSWHPPRKWSLAPLATLLLAATAGCPAPELQTEYGQRTGPTTYASVNGTAVFASMFEQAGNTVFSWPLLSPRLNQRADVIVWFPDDFQPPPPKVRRWLQHWLRARPGRTLIYVGRHFDAAAWYWARVEPLAQGPKQREIRRRKFSARAAFAGEIRGLKNTDGGDWFQLSPQTRPQPVRSLAGQPDWTRDIDPAKLDIELFSSITPADDAEILLRSGSDILVSRRRLGHSNLILVANGSFLLNAPLANHQHRKLAWRLIQQTGPPPHTVAFLESSPGGPEISDEDPRFGPPLGLALLNTWPTNWILLHWIVVGVIFCFVRYPLFGRPLQPPPDTTSDFGKHITALANLLAKTNNTAYALDRLKHYRQTTRKE